MSNTVVLTSSSIAAPAKRSRFGLFLVILGAAFVPITLLTLWFGPRYLETHRIDPAVVIGFSVPSDWRSMGAYEAAGGSIARYLITSIPQEISFVRAKNFLDASKLEQQLSPRDVLAAVDAFQRKKVISEEVAPLVIKYLAAHFDVKRLKEISDSKQTINRVEHPTVKFAFKTEQFYELALWNEGVDQVLALVFRKEGEPLPLATPSGN